MPALTLGTLGEEMNLRIRQGATFGPHLFRMTNPDGSPVNLTGCTIRGQIRKTALAPSAALSFTATITDAAQGRYQLLFTAAQTAAIKAGEKETDSDSKYVWDLEFVDSTGAILPLYYGVVTVFREVTRV